jgi:hypothetical protein
VSSSTHLSEEQHRASVLEQWTKQQAKEEMEFKSTFAQRLQLYEQQKAKFDSEQKKIYDDILQPEHIPTPVNTTNIDTNTNENTDTEPSQPSSQSEQPAKRQRTDTEIL